MQKFNLEPNTGVVSYSLHLVIHHLKRATLVFHYLFFIMFPITDVMAAVFLIVGKTDERGHRRKDEGKN